MKQHKCAVCGHPKEPIFQSHEEVRYRCTMCGKHSVEVLPQEEAEKADEPENFTISVD